VLQFLQRNDAAPHLQVARLLLYSAVSTLPGAAAIMPIELLQVSTPCTTLHLAG